MSKEEILNYEIPHTKNKKGQTTFDMNRWKGIKLTRDLIDAKTGNVIAEAGTKLTPRLAKKFATEGLTEVQVDAEELIGRYIAKEYINEDTGEIYIEAGEEITAATMKILEDLKVKDIPVLHIDHVNVGPYLLNTSWRIVK
jgi:DNA-directed RNA polymerase subunit beta